MTFPRHFAPVWTFAVRKSRECAALAAEVRRLRLDNAILTARWKLATEQRDRARDIAVAVEGDDSFAYERELLGWGGVSARYIIRCDVDVEIMQHMGSDAAIVAAAKVSTKGAASAEEFDNEAGAGLLGFLMKNRHGTPFEHNAMTFLISAPIFVFREFHRHRIGWSYNEESGRYKQLDPVFYVPGADRNLVQIGKPGHYEYVPGTTDQALAQVSRMASAYHVAYDAYEDALEAGIAREMARATLPVAIYSSMYATCNARSLMAFLSLRTKHPEAALPSFPQREIEMVAEKMEAEFARLFPLTHAAFCAHGRVSP